MINNIADCISYFHCNNSRTRSLMDRKLWSHEEYQIRDIGARERELDSSQISTCREEWRKRIRNKKKLKVKKLRNSTTRKLFSYPPTPALPIDDIQQTTAHHEENRNSFFNLIMQNLNFHSAIFVSTEIGKRLKLFDFDFWSLLRSFHYLSEIERSVRI